LSTLLLICLLPCILPYLRSCSFRFSLFLNGLLSCFWLYPLLRLILCLSSSSVSCFVLSSAFVYSAVSALGSPLPFLGILLYLSLCFGKFYWPPGSPRGPRFWKAVTLSSDANQCSVVSLASQGTCTSIIFTRLQNTYIGIPPSGKRILSARN
jgi:hypothetical protein